MQNFKWRFLPIAIILSIGTFFYLFSINVFAVIIADGDVIKNPSASGMAQFDVYIVKLIGAKKFKRIVLNPQVFESYGHLSWSNVKSVDQTTMDSYTTSELVRTDGDTKVYKLVPDGDAGSKEWLNMTAEAFAVSYDWDSIYTVNSTDVGNYNVGSNIELSSIFELKSSFLKNNLTAKSIASGQLESYDIKYFAFKYGEAEDVSTDNFAYKFLSALRMMGYTIGATTIAGQYEGEAFLNRFQDFNNLSRSPQINSAALKIIDSGLFSKENDVKNSAENFPLFSHFIDAPLNEPTKQHSAALLANIFKELPSNLVVWSEDNFKKFFSAQLAGHYKDINNSDYQICDIFLYGGLRNDCVFPAGFYKEGVFSDDFDNATTKLHEYAHYLDRNLHSRDSSISRGLIDTTNFYAISYNLSDTGLGETYAYKNPSNIKNEFISAYALGWQASDSSQHFTAAEDFAESFVMYVSEGKVFRNLANNNSIIKEKYNWLKQNVFGGQEYQSGDVNSATYLQQNSMSPKVSTGAFNMRDYSQSLPSFVWNYKFLNGSIVSK